jgi:hypothetical protein
MDPSKPYLIRKKRKEKKNHWFLNFEVFFFFFFVFPKKDGVNLIGNELVRMQKKALSLISHMNVLHFCVLNIEEIEI